MTRYYVRTNEGAYLQGHANPTPLWTKKVEDAEMLDTYEATQLSRQLNKDLRPNVVAYPELILEDVEPAINGDFKQSAIDSLFMPIATTETDEVNHPSHYNQYTFEAIDIIDEVAPKYPIEVAMEIGNAIKYLLRAPFKGRLIQDLNKAVWYINRAIDNLEKSEKYDYEDD